MAEFLTLREKQLKSETQSEERLSAARRGPNCVIQSLPAQILHGVAERPNAREYQPVGLQYHLRISRNQRMATHSLDGFFHTSEVSHSIVNDYRLNRIHQARGLPSWTEYLECGDPCGLQAPERGLQP